MGIQDDFNENFLKEFQNSSLFQSPFARLGQLLHQTNQCSESPNSVSKMDVEKTVKQHNDLFSSTIDPAVMKSSDLDMSRTYEEDYCQSNNDDLNVKDLGQKQSYPSTEKHHIPNQISNVCLNQSSTHEGALISKSVMKQRKKKKSRLLKSNNNFMYSSFKLKPKHANFFEKKQQRKRHGASSSSSSSKFGEGSIEKDLEEESKLGPFAWKFHEQYADSTDESPKKSPSSSDAFSLDIQTKSCSICGGNVTENKCTIC